MNWITDPQIWAALVTLTALEVVLGIDNIIFISILTGKLPHNQQTKGRLMGLGLAMFARIALLFSITLIMTLTAPWITVFNNEISGRDLILIAGGLFLLAKSTFEIHEKLEADEHKTGVPKSKSTFAKILIQIILLDIVFSLDSVITAVGMTNDLPVMIAAVVIAVGFMMIASKSISGFVEKHPTIKVLALSFLLLIGIALIADGLDIHIPKGYIYFAMAFSVFVEMINIKVHKIQSAKANQEKE
jgi:predicted tellurium resistance membrane protein TerC